MYVCICNNITEKDLETNPHLRQLVGTQCGRCQAEAKPITGVKGSRLIVNSGVENRAQATLLQEHK